MSKDNFAVGMVNYICPICAKVIDHAIIMNQRLTKEDADEVRKANGQTVGYADHACEKCAAHKDECIYVIEINAEKSLPNNPYRTGMYWGLRKDFALFVEHPEYVLKTKDGVQFCFMDKEFANKIALPHENN